jgi:hypothetical protein
MSNADLLGLVGSVALFALAGVLLWIGAHPLRYGRYGQEALICAGCWTLVVALMRVLSISHVVSTDVVRRVNTMSAVTALVIIAGTVTLYRTEHNRKKEIRK